MTLTRPSIRFQQNLTQASFLKKTNVLLIRYTKPKQAYSLNMISLHLFIQFRTNVRRPGFSIRTYIRTSYKKRHNASSVLRSCILITDLRTLTWWIPREMPRTCSCLLCTRNVRLYTWFNSQLRPLTTQQAVTIVAVLQTLVVPEVWRCHSGYQTEFGEYQTRWIKISLIHRVNWNKWL
jgi:hypothetical protein